MIEMIPLRKTGHFASMSLVKPTIVIFDMDGTAVRHLNPAILHVLEKLDDGAYRVKKFFDRVFRRDKKALFVSEAEEAYHARKKPRLLVHRAIHKFRRKPVEQIVEPCPGIFQVLELLKSEGIPTAIVSNGLGKGYGHEIMDTFGFGQYFDAALFREDIHNSSPTPSRFYRRSNCFWAKAASRARAMWSGISAIGTKTSQPAWRRASSCPR